MPPHRPRVAVVLGAGGLKCPPGIALFELLEELAITLLGDAFYGVTLPVLEALANWSPST